MIQAPQRSNAHRLLDHVWEQPSGSFRGAYEIPHFTQNSRRAPPAQIPAPVNLSTDLLAPYVDRHLGSTKASIASLFLPQFQPPNGFSLFSPSEKNSVDN
ncbi:MAG: hypothetical protein JNN08_32075 [Bryobacterales bacterium]|nr:hypothetical protein [Bryobacterales bacterium]